MYARMPGDGEKLVAEALPCYDVEVSFGVITTAGAAGVSRKPSAPGVVSADAAPARGGTRCPKIIKASAERIPDGSTINGRKCCALAVLRSGAKSIFDRTLLARSYFFYYDYYYFF